MYTTRITRTLEENPGARKVRTAVFMEEQGYKNEFDGHDADAVHWAGWLCSGSAGAIGWAAGLSRSWRSISAAWMPKRSNSPPSCMP